MACNKSLGLDIGGANLKAADGCGRACSLPFALWREPHQLATRLSVLRSELDRISGRHAKWDVLAITMTGELCDCFTSRSEGVHAILEAVDRVFPDTSKLVWSSRGDFLTFDQARVRPLEVASANWLATAHLCSRFLSSGEDAIVIDIGSTTTDLTPIRGGTPVPFGRSDLERLRSSELIYRGIRRTPLMALAEHVFFQGRFTNIMAERFATTEDVYLVLGDLPERPHETETADGRPATRQFALQRLARMVGTDAGLHDEADLLDLARQFDAAMCRQLRNALWRVMARSLPGSKPKAFLCGSGEFLARRVVEESGLEFSEVVALSERFGPAVSECICAYAVAVLAEGTR
ncbi:MAG: hypothetical protein NZM31_13725 [Gemmatales bacterium]|nr:hypothetical protein [Gemmatales bacterium]MDW8388055.1 hydantoinase/oxoprolinase family protein [Gemmatales bacterium]